MGIDPHEFRHLEPCGDVTPIGPEGEEGKGAMIKKGKESLGAEGRFSDYHQRQVEDGGPHHKEADRVVTEVTKGIFDLAGSEIQEILIDVRGDRMAFLP